MDDDWKLMKTLFAKVKELPLAHVSLVEGEKGNIRYNRTYVSATNRYSSVEKHFIKASAATEH